MHDYKMPFLMRSLSTSISKHNKLLFLNTAKVEQLGKI